MDEDQRWQNEISRVNRPRSDAAAAYDRMSAFYDLLAGSSERPFQERALRWLDAQPGERVLEIGFGTGHGLLALAQSVGAKGQVYGVDLSFGMCRAAWSRVDRAGAELGLGDPRQAPQAGPQVAVCCGDALALPFATGALDAVFLSFTLELLDTPEIPLALQECRRVLRAGGRLAIAAMSRERQNAMTRLYEWAHARFPRYVDCRPIHVQAALREAGFHTLKAETRSMWGLPVAVVLAQNGTCSAEVGSFGKS
jgi:ubiquinone/menaquinone biosynthesis C-methylase UbiE